MVCLVEDLMFLEDEDCAVYFCISQISWRLEVLHMQWVKHVHKGMFGNIICPHCRPSLAHQLTPPSRCVQNSVACSPWNPVSRATGGRPPGGHVHLSLSILVTGSVSPSPFMAHMPFSGLPGRALFPRSTPLILRPVYVVLFREPLLQGWGSRLSQHALVGVLLDALESKARVSEGTQGTGAPL